MNDNIISLPSALRPVNVGSAVANLITMAQIEREIPTTMTGVDGMETLAEAVAGIADRVSRDEAVILLGVGAMLLRVTRGCPRPEETPNPWPVGLVAHVEAMLPPLPPAETDGYYQTLGKVGPDAIVPAVYVALLCARIKHLEAQLLAADVQTRSEVADLIGANIMAQPAGEA
ncbi:hypothetical protein [Sphingomonas montanisoli]|uniref:Uncharacterized protein n=1 Tax=Sphingomonas montanisoli TaxID=2606412 RepID=A0A5D9CEN0_9SPHN|nr:hypothetical protein [Sphingomonas montanisoli]TZG28595.1 hypothetical protein FYJ91_00095 [Sphingomonas montanisoli]